MSPVYDGRAQAVGIPHGPPEERPLPTSRSVLTRPASAVRAAPGAGRAGGAPALPTPSGEAGEALDRSLDVLVRRPRVDRAQPRDRAALQDRRARPGVAVGDRPADHRVGLVVVVTATAEADDGERRRRDD